MNKNTKLLLLVLLCLLVAIYYNYYASYKQDYNIIQSNLAEIDLSVLYEKYPIIIYDPMVDPRELLPTLFAYTYIRATYGATKINLPIVNKSKHMIVWNENQDLLLNIINPKYHKLITENTPLESLDKVQYVTIKLKKHQVAIIPQFWYIQTDNEMSYILLDDSMSWIAGQLGRK
jgi:hypothetical protein